jgi:PRC-barrel domain protein
MADPVSWFVVEKGWRVFGSDGKELGAIDEVIGDADSDIFNGLSVAAGRRGPPRYVPAERVREIVEGRVVLDLDHDSFGRLSTREPTRGERLRADR